MFLVRYTAHFFKTQKFIHKKQKEKPRKTYKMYGKRVFVEIEFVNRTIDNRKIIFSVVAYIKLL